LAIFGLEAFPKMLFDLESWRESFEQARTDKNAALVRELLDEAATAYRKMSNERFSSLFARFVTE
jgi:hypothetical protein